MNNLHNRSNRPTVKGLESPLFLVGKDRHGNWVARDQSGLCGGLFVGREWAARAAERCCLSRRSLARRAAAQADETIMAPNYTNCTKFFAHYSLLIRA